MNIFRRELRANRKSLLIWSAVTLLFVVTGFSKFTAYENNPEMLKVLQSLPPALLEGMSLNAFNMTTISGFFGVMNVYFALLLSIAAAQWGADVITKEERDRTVEFTLTLPVSRARLITGKLLAAFANCVVLWLVTWGSVLAISASFETNNEYFEFVTRTFGALLILQAIFLAIGFLLGCAMSNYRRAASLALSVILGTYFLSIFTGLNADLDFLKYFTPFKYFDAAVLLNEGRIEMVYVWISAVVMAVSVAGAFAYKRRDLYI